MRHVSFIIHSILSWFPNQVSTLCHSTSSTYIHTSSVGFYCEWRWHDVAKEQCHRIVMCRIRWFELRIAIRIVQDAAAYYNGQSREITIFVIDDKNRYFARVAWVSHGPMLRAWIVSRLRQSPSACRPHARPVREVKSWQKKFPFFAQLYKKGILTRLRGTHDSVSMRGCVDRQTNPFTIVHIRTYINPGSPMTGSSHP